MAKINAICAAAAKATAWVMEQQNFRGNWGVGEHLANERRLTLDALDEAFANAGKPLLDKAGKPVVGEDGKTPLVLPKLDASQAAALKRYVNNSLRATHAANPELAYASNYQKLLVAHKELSDKPEYE